jgi:hypothetical protein
MPASSRSISTALRLDLFSRLVSFEGDDQFSQLVALASEPPAYHVPSRSRAVPSLSRLEKSRVDVHVATPCKRIRFPRKRSGFLFELNNWQG